MRINPNLKPVQNAGYLPRIVLDELSSIFKNLDVLKQKPGLPKEIAEGVRNTVGVIVIGASGTGKTTLVKEVILNSDFNKVVVFSLTRQFKDLQVFHGLTVEYYDDVEAFKKYITKRIVIDYIKGYNTAIVVDDLNRLVAEKGKEVMECLNIALTNVRKYKGKVFIICHEIEDVSDILRHMGASASVNTWFLSRLAVSEYRARSIPRRLGIPELREAFRRVRDLDTGEFIMVNRDMHRIIEVHVEPLPSHIAVEECRSWIIVEYTAKDMRLSDLIVAFRREYGLHYKEIAELLGTTPKYVSKVLAHARRTGKLKDQPYRPRKARRGVYGAGYM